MNLYIAGFWLSLVLLTLAAWWGRDPVAPGWKALAQPELAVAALYWTAAAATLLIAPSAATRYMRLETAVLVIDLALFAALAAVGIRSGKWWVLCAAALQLVSTTAHVAKWATIGMYRLGYQVMEEASSYPTLILLAIGILSHRRMRKNARRLPSSSGARARAPQTRRR